MEVKVQDLVAYLEKGMDTEADVAEKHSKLFTLIERCREGIDILVLLSFFSFFLFFLGGGVVPHDMFSLAGGIEPHVAGTC